jgi:hypothetical protein
MSLRKACLVGKIVIPLQKQSQAMGIPPCGAVILWEESADKLNDVAETCYLPTERSEW